MDLTSPLTQASLQIGWPLQILELFSIHRTKWEYFSFQCIFIAVFFVMAWAALRFLRFSSR